MANKIIDFGIPALEKVRHGLNIAANAIRSTLGPFGATVIVGQLRNRPKFTKDGITVARSIQFKDPFENTGAQILIEAAEKTLLAVGDGTTTTAIMAQELFNQGLKLRKDFNNFSLIKHQIKEAADKSLEVLKKQTIKVKGVNDRLIQNIATISTNNDKYLGELISNAFKKAGDHGVLFVEQGKFEEDLLEIKDGIELKAGWEHPSFITNYQNSRAEYEGSYVVVCEDVMADENQLLTFLQKIWKDNMVRPITFIAAGYTDPVLAFLIVNRIKKQYPLVALKAPDFGPQQKDILRDFAEMFSSPIVSNELNTTLSQVNKEDLLWADRVSASKTTTTILAKAKYTKKLKDKIIELKNRAKESDNEYERAKLEERIGALTGKVVTIQVGGKTKMEVSEKRDRVDDAAHAVKSSLEHGVVPGGGISLFHMAAALDENKNEGFRLVKNMLLMPVKQLCINANLSSDLYFSELIKLSKKTVGKDFITGELVDYIEQGIVDPVSAIKESMLNAISIVNLLLNSNVVIVDDEVKDTER